MDESSNKVFVGWVAVDKRDGSAWVVGESVGGCATGTAPGDALRTMIAESDEQLQREYLLMSPGPEADRVLLADYAARLNRVTPPTLTSSAAKSLLEDTRESLAVDVTARLESFSSAARG